MGCGVGAGRGAEEVYAPAHAPIDSDAGSFLAFGS